MRDCHCWYTLDCAVRIVWYGERPGQLDSDDAPPSGAAVSSAPTASSGSSVATRREPLVRCALAARLGLLATTAQRTPLEGRPRETPPSVTAPRALLLQAQRFLETAQRCAQWRS